MAPLWKLAQLLQCSSRDDSCRRPRQLGFELMCHDKSAVCGAGSDDGDDDGEGGDNSDESDDDDSRETT